MSAKPDPRAPRRAPRRLPTEPPPPLTVACSLAVVEAMVLVLGGMLILPSLDGERFMMGATSLIFFLVYGAGLAWCAWRLSRLHAWARAPVVMSQLIQILLAAGFWGGRASWIAVAAIACALVVLAGIFHPTSLRALEIAQDPR